MNPSDILKYGHGRVLRTIADFPSAEWETPNVCGIWSTKSIMSHLASYEHWLIDILLPFTGQQVDTPYLNEIMQNGPEAFNDTQVAARKDKTPAQIVEEYTTVYTQVSELVPKISPETWRQPGTLPWYGAEYSLDDFIAYTFYGHKCEHCAQIAVFLDNLKLRPA